MDNKEGQDAATIEDLKDERVPSCLTWSYEEVADWIEELGFPYYRTCFTTNLINGRKLMTVEASQLPQIGITDFEHIKFIAKSIRELLGVEDPDWSRSISIPPRSDLGMYLEKKSMTGEVADELTYNKFLRTANDVNWQPPLSNHCLMLPHD